jgi:hypothetical protein
VRSAEVAEEHDQRGASQEVAQTVRAVQPVNRGIAQLRGHRLPEAHAGTIALRRRLRRRVAIGGRATRYFSLRGPTLTAP